MKKYIVWAIIAVVVYFAWRRFGGDVKSVITGITK